ncbi:UPF0481 protein At3g47200-like [Zingiber officinale]|uniref:Uncharacterized protein n=1 Tax=Zingiber officinale TaxID=94328 RepID=A0A8J5GPW5_ZINOF|nr:UPF0481 protein At3g47200-like [Zingiber officinale]KAG6512627.1 hypothetical protein ZIOFF_030752 [Zingiber officinale]
MKNTEDERIETSLDMDWVASLEMKVSDTKFRDRNREPTIYRVPDMLKSVDPQAYEPLLVSLGPYHRDKPHLQAMNRLKWKYLKFVLEQNPGMVMKDYVGLVKGLETQARVAYSEEVKMSSNSFVEMMLLDGCFLMLTIMGWTHRMEISEESTWWTHFNALQDIFMLENQLPFFLLETLYQYAFPHGDRFRSLTVELIRMRISSDLKPPSNKKTFHHIIHFCLSCIDPTTNPEKDYLGPGIPWIPSATIFNEAGIHFGRKKRYKSFLDITFHNGKLEIPQLRIEDGINSLLRNLIAYEQCSMNSKFRVTSYMVLMDSLINTAADVELLQQHEIIIGDLGDNQEIATLFNKLGTNVSYTSYNFYLADVVNAMRKHHDTRCNKWRARLNRDYFSNPWAVISLFGALALFVLTVIQTTYAVLSYDRSSN